MDGITAIHVTVMKLMVISKFIYYVSNSQLGNCSARNSQTCNSQVRRLAIQRFAF